MGTLSKRGLDEFGVDVKERIEGFRRSVGRKIENVGGPVTVTTAPTGIGAQISRRLEKLSAKPASTWFALAGASVVSSLALRLGRRPLTASFVAMWAPTFLAIGLYKKLVRLPEHDRHDVH